MFTHKQDLVGLFAQHRVASNLLMMVMILAGLWGLTRLNTQFFPNFNLDIISVRVIWTGASTDDVERSIVDPLEQELRNVDHLKEMSSTSANGVASITLEFDEGTSMGTALDQVKEKVGLVRELPSTAEEPEVTLVARYEPIARVLVSGAPDLRELRPLVHAMERDLLDRGIARVEIEGLPEEEIAIQVPMEALYDLGMSLDRIGDRIRQTSRDFPAGTVGEENVARELRSLEQRRRAADFETLPLISDEAGRLVSVGDVAQVERRPRRSQVKISSRDQPAVELLLMRSESSDSLKSARILDQWLEAQRKALPQGVRLEVYDQSWQLIRQRISLLLKNGAGGLVLVVGILFLFLNGRVATWVAVGIPVSFMATLAILYGIGGSINMISLFALIMALGIIVDDAIVVGEDALAHYQSGEASLEAAEGGARRMLAPVLSSSLTTIAAFLPLMLVGGIIGNILVDIPIVVTCVLLASLVECFLVLPGHLRHAFRHLHHKPPSALRQRLDAGFSRLRDVHFRRLVSLTVDHREATVSLAVGLLILCIGLVAGGYIKFTFFPTVESNIVMANASFVAGTPRARVDGFLGDMERALRETEQELGGDLVLTSVVRHGSLPASGDRPAQQGDTFGSILVELIPSDTRDVRNETFIETWQARLRLPAGIENFTIQSRRAGHPGRSVNVELSGARPPVLKQASLDLLGALKVMPGVSGMEDDMPWGQEQLIYRLTPQGEAMGLTIEGVGRQLRAAFDGHLAQIFHDGEDEVEVRVVLPDRERDDLNRLDDLPIATGKGTTVPLPTALDLRSRRSFEVLRHTDSELASHVFADVNRAVANENRVRKSLEDGILSDLVNQYGIRTAFKGKAEDQKETLTDMRHGVVLALVLIYLILAWVFASYGWPLVIMTTIPFAIIGAIAGHWLMGIDLTILSLFGVFGLAGIVVNDSIILMSFYRHLRETGMEMREAVIEAACRRLRAVLLTSLTTIAGLTPLLFETSLQAQFLIPMAVSISFGLAFSTVLVLLVIPALLSIHESIAQRFERPVLQAGG